METKQCKSCKQEKTSEHFYKKGKYLYRKCKQCVSDDNFIKKRNLIELGVKKCTVCGEEKKINQFYESKGVFKSECKSCTTKKNNERDKLKRGSDKNSHRKLLSIFEMESELKKDAKKISKNHKKTEAWKLANGWTWVTEEVQFTKTTTKKQRVLRKLNK